MVAGVESNMGLQEMTGLANNTSSFLAALPRKLTI
jgi:hypothetical protein